jgi:hypothetical protein
MCQVCHERASSLFVSTHCSVTNGNDICGYSVVKETACDSLFVRVILERCRYVLAFTYHQLKCMTGKE